MEAHLAISVHDDAVLVQVGGELDVASAGQLREMLEPHTSCDLRLDFSEVTFVDSAAVRALMALHRACDDHGRALVVVGLNGVTRRTILLLGLYNVLTGLPADAPVSPPVGHRLSA